MAFKLKEKPSSYYVGMAEDAFGGWDIQGLIREIIGEIHLVHMDETVTDCYKEECAKLGRQLGEVHKSLEEIGRMIDRG